MIRWLIGEMKDVNVVLQPEWGMILLLFVKKCKFKVS